MHRSTSLLSRFNIIAYAPRLRYLHIHTISTSPIILPVRKFDVCEELGPLRMIDYVSSRAVAICCDS
jgi:hypothetical protein